MAEVSLRPMSLRPGGGAGTNPFAKFGKGAAPTKAAKAPAVDAANLVKKPAGEVVRYDRGFLLRFSQKFADLPPGLEPSHSEAIINKDDPNQQAARQAAQSALPVADDSDDRNWRTRAPLPPAADGAAPPERELIRGPPAANGAPERPSPAGPRPADSQQQQQNGPTGGAPPRNDSTSQLQSASDVGKKAWMPGTTSAAGDAAALKSVKGVLNKLTPEKFDRLLGLLVAAVTSVDVLNGLIKLVFDNAIEQPTFVAMYAELCEALAQQLPELAPPKGETKPMSFQRLLLNHCQDQFEGTLERRKDVAKLSGGERDVAERDLKKRTLGITRLIAELYKKSVVKEPVVHVCISELLGAPNEKPLEDNVEALCEMFSVAGKKLEETSRSPARVEGYLKAMEKLTKTDGIAPRIRFLIRDVLDLRRMKWVPRRETLKAKKLDEIHAEAHAELGMMPALAMASLPPLPGLAQLGPARPAAAEEVDLFPAFKGAEDGDWQKFLSGSGAPGGGGGSKSALLGDFTPVAQPAEAQPAGAVPDAASNATPPDTSAAPQYLQGLSDEERERRADGLFTEFLSSNDEKEALLCAHELAAPGFLPTLVQRGVLKLLDLMKAREQETVSDLLVRLPSMGAYSADDLRAGFGKVTEQLDDLMMDAPLAPKLCAGVLGRALLQGVLPADAIPELCKPIEGGEVRRALVAPALQYVKDQGGEDKLRELVAGLSGSDFLAADPELDPPDLPPVAEFLSQEGLTALAA